MCPWMIASSVLAVDRACWLYIAVPYWPEQVSIRRTRLSFWGSRL
jgi:hypothetical protein